MSLVLEPRDFPKTCCIIFCDFILVRINVDYSFVPRTITIIQPLLLFSLLVLWRVLAQKVIIYFSIGSLGGYNLKSNILLFGSGQSAREIIQTLQSSNKYKIVGILDENKKNQGQYLDNISTFSQDKIDVKHQYKIDLILIIKNSIEKVNIEIRKKLLKYNIPIKIPKSR